MNKRLRKKVHKVYLIDVVCGVSLSPYWRKKMFQSIEYEKHLINKFNNKEIDKSLQSIIKKYNLKYTVYIIPYEEALQEWEDLESTQVYFKFEPVEFPHLVDYSANNPAVIDH